MHSPAPRVIFFLVKEVKAKIQKITQVAHFHFSKREHLLLSVQDATALKFLDELLWKEPEVSFLPHTISDSPASELIILTMQKKNLNNSKYLFNLCPTPLLFETEAKIIYELEDATSPNKHLLSQQRMQAYKAAKYPIESR